MISGIYSICNLLTGDEYIGSTVDLDYRWYRHQYKLQRGIHHNPHLQRSWDKYGKENFRFEILEETTQLRDHELFWIYRRQPIFNCDNAFLRKDPDGLGFCHSEETRKKISKSNMGRTSWLKGKVYSNEERMRMSRDRLGKPGHPQSKETRSKLSESHKGHTVSDETRMKISKSHKGCSHVHKGYIVSDETRIKMSKSHKGKILSDKTRAKISEIRKIYWQSKKAQQI